MSLHSASDTPVQVIGKVILFDQLADLHIHVHFGVVNSLAVPLLFGASFIDRFVKRIFSMERFIVPIWSPLVAIIPEYSLRRIRWLCYRLIWTPRSIQKTNRTTKIGCLYF